MGMGMRMVLRRVIEIPRNRVPRRWMAATLQHGVASAGTPSTATIVVAPCTTNRAIVVTRIGVASSMATQRRGHAVITRKRRDRPLAGG